MKVIYPLLGLVLIASLSTAQVRPGQVYEPGEELIASRLGVSTIVPKGWSGVLPMDTEVFLLMSQSASFGQIYVTGGEDSKDEIKKRWSNGVELGNGIKIILDGETFERNGAIAAKIKLEEDPARAGYVEAKCGPFGNCIIAALFSEKNQIKPLIAGVTQFIDAVEFSEPGSLDPYANFDWRQFLAAKYMVSYERLQGSKREVEVWFCPDGSFSSKVVNKGAFADISNDYSGKNKGTWVVIGSGASSTLTMSFGKLPPLDIEMKIEEEQVFANGVRYFFMENDTCK